jgi:hypothetical protein
VRQIVRVPQEHGRQDISGQRVLHQGVHKEQIHYFEFMQDTAQELAAEKDMKGEIKSVELPS